MEVRMKKQTKIFLLFAIVSPVLLTAESYKYSGKAGDLKSGKFLYTDNHIETRSEGKHLSSVITYRDAKGNVIARKNIQFTKNSYLPDFELEDLRSGYIEGGVLQGKSYKVYYKKDKNSEKKEKSPKRRNSKVSNQQVQNKKHSFVFSEKHGKIHQILKL